MVKETYEDGWECVPQLSKASNCLEEARHEKYEIDNCVRETPLGELVVNLKELQADSELRSTRRLVALKERMGDDQTSVKVNGDEMVNELKEAHEKDEYVYPYWTVSQEDQVSDVLSIDVDSGINDIQALLLELSLERPDKVLTLTASARVRMVVKNGEVIKSSKFEDFYIMDEEVKEEAKIFNNLVPASHDGMGNFKTK